MIQVTRSEEIETSLRAGTYDFIDFGCSNGGSMEFAGQTLGARRGLGVDIDAKKVESTRALGFDAVEYDLTQLTDLPNVVSFCILSHFLEHLHGYPVARRCIDSAIAASRDFVLIRHPWFDADTNLMMSGLKMFWSDWHGHTHNMRAFDIYRAAIRNRKVEDIRLFGCERIADSSHAAVLPLSAAIDRHHYDPSLDGPKPHVAFDFLVYGETVCVIGLRGAVDLDTIVEKIGRCERLDCS